jgi:hypothetical protein
MGTGQTGCPFFPGRGGATELVGANIFVRKYTGQILERLCAVTQSFLNRLEASPIVGLGTTPWSWIQTFNVSGAVDQLGYVPATVRASEEKILRYVGRLCWVLNSRNIASTDSNRNVRYRYDADN